MTRRWGGILTAFAVSVGVCSGCSLELEGLASAQADVNECSVAMPCAVGECVLGRCAVSEGDFDTVLLEVTAPTTAPALGGVQFLQILTGMAQSDERNINLSVPSRLVGFVTAYDPEALAECLDSAEDTLPVEITLTPRGKILGLPTISQTTTTHLTRLESKSEVAAHLCNRGAVTIPQGRLYHEFEFLLPAGDYDIYVRSALPPDPDRNCQIVPYVRRNQRIPVGEVCLPLRPGAPTPFSAKIPWGATAPEGQTLEGWSASIVHSVTGELLSTVQVLDAGEAADGTTTYDVSLDYAAVQQGADYGAPNEELLRLEPPMPEDGPVIQLSLQRLNPFGEDENRIPGLKPFPAPVELHGWVWEKEAFDARDEEVPVAASVTFTATKLAGIGDGLFASFSTTVDVEEGGELVAPVLPGEYVVQIVPEVGSGLAASEATLSVPCEALPSDPTQCAPRPTTEAVPEVQAGKAFFVPSTASLEARVTQFSGADPLRGTAVDARAGQIRARRCSDVSDGGTCELAPLDLLEVSLGGEAFVPRSNSVLTDDSGRFSIELDCGTCDEGGGAVFDLLVRPEPATGFPWLVKPGISVQADVSLGDISLPLPVIRRGAVQVPQSATTPVAVPGALVRAYIFRDALGRYVKDPAGSENCTAESTDFGCLRSILQIGETRAAADGSYELVLPSHLD